MMSGSLPLLIVEGSHRDVGKQIGAGCAEVLRRAVEFDQGETPAEGRSLDQQLALAAEYRSVTRQQLPYLVDELDAVAEAADVDPVRLFAASTEEIWASPPLTGPGGKSSLATPRGRCTDLVAGAPRTVNGDLLVAHNNDLDAGVEESLVAIDWRVDGEPRMFTIGVGPWISVGWNVSGLLLSGNELAPNDDRIGVPRLLLVREQLRKTVMDSAVSAALFPGRASAYNTIFAMPDGQVVNVEGSATDGVVTGLDEHGTLVHTNHYVCDAMLGYENDHAYAKRSALRYERGYELLRQAEQRAETVTTQSLKAMLGDGALCNNAFGEQVFIDIPEPNQAGLRLAARHGMSPVFACERMYLRGDPGLPLDEIYGITSFEAG